MSGDYRRYFNLLQISLHSHKYSFLGSLFCKKLPISFAFVRASVIGHSKGPPPRNFNNQNLMLIPNLSFQYRLSQNGYKIDL